MRLNVVKLVTVSKTVEIDVSDDNSDNIERYLDEKFGARGWMSYSKKSTPISPHNND